MQPDRTCAFGADSGSFAACQKLRKRPSRRSPGAAFATGNCRRRFNSACARSWSGRRRRPPGRTRGARSSAPGVFRCGCSACIVRCSRARGPCARPADSGGWADLDELERALAKRKKVQDGIRDRSRPKILRGHHRLAHASKPRHTSAFFAPFDPLHQPCRTLLPLGRPVGLA